MSNNKGIDSYKIKDSIVPTPPIVSNKIYQDLKRKPFHNILDIGSYDGRLSNPFKRKKNINIIGLDIEDTYRHQFDKFIHKDFLETTKDDFKDLNIDFIICNPPFQRHKGKNELYPMLFLEHIFEIFPKTIPIVMIAPQWFYSNSNKRINFLNKINITKKITLHKGIFGNVSVESSIIYINIKTHTPQEYLANKTYKPQNNRTFKSIPLRKDQKEFIDNNIENFSKEVKELIKIKFPDFPL